MTEEVRRIGRRRFVRTAGAAAVGLTAAVATPRAAQADPGAPVLLGSSANDAGAAQTTLSASAPGPTLRVQNPNAAFLRVNPVDRSSRGTAQLGAVAVDPASGTLSVGSNLAPAGGPANPGWCDVITDGNATMTVATKPRRLLDTRTAAGRALIVGGVENIDGQGRLRGGTTLVLNLDDWVLLGEAVHINLTVAKTTGHGYLTIWGVGSRPYASALNWWGSNQVLANAALCTLGTYGPYLSVFGIYANVATAVIADLTGFDVAGPWQVNPDILPGSAAGSAVAPSAAGKDMVARSFAAGALRAAGGARHAAGPATAGTAARRRPGVRALQI